MIDHGAAVSLPMILLARNLIPSFSDLETKATQPVSSFLERAFSTWSTMYSGCFPSTATGRPYVFGKNSASLRKCGTLAACSSGPTIVPKLQGLSLSSLGSNGSSARAVEQLLHQVQLLLLRRQQIQGFSTKTKTDSERDLGRLCLPARIGGPDAGGAGDHPAIPEAVSANITAVVEWWLMIEANTCIMQRRNRVGNEKLEMICEKLEPISQKLDWNQTWIRQKLERN